MRDNIHLAQRFVTALTFEMFRTSKLHFYATTRAIEIVSEASRRLTDEMRERHPHLPWRAIRDSGNLYRHQDDDVAETSVWRTVHEELPPLLDVINREIAAFEGRDRRL